MLKTEQRPIGLEVMEKDLTGVGLSRASGVTCKEIWGSYPFRSGGGARNTSGAGIWGLIAERTSQASATPQGARMTDTREAREHMVSEQLQSRGITDARVLQAMRDVPRERFVEAEFVDDAYADRPLPIPEGQTISQPYIVALMAQAAAIAPGQRVLEVGAGSGYGAAVLSHLAARVWSVERNPRLARLAGAHIAELGRANVTVLRADGANGWAPAAPFDAIVVTAAGPEVPQALKDQLAIGGRLIIPVGDPGGTQVLRKITRVAIQDWREENLEPVHFVPLVRD